MDQLRISWVDHVINAEFLRRVGKKSKLSQFLHLEMQRNIFVKRVIGRRRISWHSSLKLLRREVIKTSIAMMMVDKQYSTTIHLKVAVNCIDQLYTFHADLRSSDKDTCVWPSVYALLPKKKKKTCFKILYLMRTNVPHFKLKNIKTDFEKLTILSWREAFPEYSIKGCNQCFWHKEKELRLTMFYKEDQDVKTDSSIYRRWTTKHILTTQHFLGEM